MILTASLSSSCQKRVPVSVAPPQVSIPTMSVGMDTIFRDCIVDGLAQKCAYMALYEMFIYDLERYRAQCDASPGWLEED